MITLSGFALLGFSTVSFGAANYCASDSLAENLSLLRNVASSSAANLEAKDTSKGIDYYDSFVAYTKYDGEFKKLQKAVTNFCNDINKPDDNEDNQE
jgi:hypothetical protein